MTKLTAAQHKAMGIAMVAVIVKNQPIPVSLINRKIVTKLCNSGYFTTSSDGRLWTYTLTVKGCRYVKQYFS